MVATSFLGSWPTGPVMSEAGVYRFGYVGGKRYVKLLAAFSGTHGTGTPIAGVVIRGLGQINPQAAQA